MAVRPVILNKNCVSLYDEWIRYVAEGLDNISLDRNEFVSEILCGIYGLSSDCKNLSEKALMAQMDPRNCTMEAEYYGEMDTERFYRIKPILLLWQMFDRSPLGHNVALGIPFRAMLAKRIFNRCGTNVRLFHDIEFSFGYNITCGNNVQIHRKVLIDDRGEVIIGNNVSISDYVNIYSHAHDPLDIRNVSIYKTVIGDGVRLTYHSTILAGVTIEDDALIGCHGVATKDVKKHHIAVGLPAKSVRVKERAEGTPQ